MENMSYREPLLSNLADRRGESAVSELFDDIYDVIQSWGGRCSASDLRNGLTGSNWADPLASGRTWRFDRYTTVHEIADAADELGFTVQRGTASSGRRGWTHVSI